MTDMPERYWIGERGFWGFPKEGATEYVRVDSPPKVKPLEWKQFGRSYCAPAPLFGNIRVENYWQGKWTCHWSVPGITDSFTAGLFDTAEAAQLAAQADYEARILAVLVQP